jgi:RNA-directed DNA polymerase
MGTPQGAVISPLLANVYLHYVLDLWAKEWGVPNKGDAPTAFRYHVIGIWRGVLRKRSDQDRTTWDEINRLAKWWLPRPRICHPWPNRRFAVTHPRWEPYAGKPHVRFCAGACSNARPYRDRCGRAI